MRRFLAITLLIAFGFPVLSAFADLRVEGRSRLAACCRKGGAHHCTGDGASITSAGPALSALPCSRFPSPAKTGRLFDTTAPALRVRPEAVAGFDEPAPPSDRGGVTFEGWAAHSKRGPPAPIA